MDWQIRSKILPQKLKLAAKPFLKPLQDWATRELQEPHLPLAIFFYLPRVLQTLLQGSRSAVRTIKTFFLPQKWMALLGSACEEVALKLRTRSLQRRRKVANLSLQCWTRARNKDPPISPSRWILVKLITKGAIESLEIRHLAQPPNNKKLILL